MRYRNHTASAVLLAVGLLITTATTGAHAETIMGETNLQTSGEFRTGLGAAPVQTLFELFTDLTTTALLLGSIEASTDSKHPAAFVEYVRPMGERSRLIAHFNITSYEKTYIYTNSGEEAARINDDFYTFMLGAKHHYLRTGSFALYLDAMAGFSMLHSTSDNDELETDGSFLLAFQVTPLGMRIGRTVAIDLALGLGYKGLLTFGVGYEF